MTQELNVPSISRASASLFSEHALDLSSFNWISCYLAHGLGLDTPPVESLLHSIPFNLKEAPGTSKLQLFIRLGILALAHLSARLAELKPVSIFSEEHWAESYASRQLDARNLIEFRFIRMGFKTGDRAETVTISVSPTKLSIFSSLSRPGTEQIHKIVEYAFEFGDVDGRRSGEFGLRIVTGSETSSFRIDLRTSRVFINRALANFCIAVGSRSAFAIPPCAACGRSSWSRSACQCYSVFYCDMECYLNHKDIHGPDCTVDQVPLDEGE